MTLEQQITEILKVQAKLKGQELATRLGIDKHIVNACLHRHRGKRFIQDSGYRWQLVQTAGSASAGISQSSSSATEIDTPLTRLCRYYLDCISHEDLDISVFASSKYELDYLELQTMPLVSDDLETFTSQAAIRLLNKTRRDRSRIVIHLGYPVRLKHVRSKTGWKGFKVEPVCVWTYQENPESASNRPTIAEITPIFNFAILKIVSPQWRKLLRRLNSFE
ncbi:MAG: hypothetical protein ABI811_04630 [Acidobacteriota bacterium]